jgi:ParB-like chromosome segregation protein Spo0J
VKIPIASIEVDSTQIRIAFNREVIDEYAADMGEGTKLPDVVIYQDSEGKHWLADGWYRLAGAIKLGWTEIDAEMRQGTLFEALLYGIEANLPHGVRLSIEDCKNAAEILLKDTNSANWSSREIAKRCKLTDKTVEKLRKSLSADNPQMQTRTVRRGNQEYPQKVKRKPKSSKPSGLATATPEPASVIRAESSLGP